MGREQGRGGAGCVCGEGAGGEGGGVCVWGGRRGEGGRGGLPDLRRVVLLVPPHPGLGHHLSP